MKNQAYLDLMTKKFGDITHILDSPDCNIPVLSMSKANFFTEKIKMVCPRMFPTSDETAEQIIEAEKMKNARNFSDLANPSLDLNQTYNGFDF